MNIWVASRVLLLAQCFSGPSRAGLLVHGDKFLLGAFPGVGILESLSHGIVFVYNSELKDMGFVHSDLIKSHSAEVGAFTMHIFSERGQVTSRRTHSSCRADLGAPALLWDPPCLYPCILPRFRGVKARSSPLMQPSSSLMSLQSYSLSHCWLPWMQVPSKHWNSSGRHVATARKDRARADFSQGEAETQESPSLKKQFSDSLTGVGCPGPCGQHVNGGALDMGKHTQPPPL